MKVDLTGLAGRSLTSFIQVGVVLAAAACSSSSIPTGSTDPATLDFTLTTVATGLESPVYVTAPIADPRVFVVEQPGRIRVIRDGTLLSEPYLDLTDRVRFGGEQGLLGLAFDPDFRASGRFFVYYTDAQGTGRLEAYVEVDRSDRADPNSDLLFLEVEQPFPNHNGGQVAFGPDNMLYLGLGDGGSGGDPKGHGQDANTLLGAILRLEVLDQLGPPYRIPDDNPFANDPERRPEIWHYGLRNPWRFSFDPDGGDVFIADVGQDRWEEINVIDAGESGANFGWNVMEGSECFRQLPCSAEGMTLPTVVYGHGAGCSVTGGYVYRGDALPAFVGRYLYSDYCSGWIRSFVLGPTGASDPVQHTLEEPIGRVTSLGQDAQRELYVTTEDGRVLRLDPRS